MPVITYNIPISLSPAYSNQPDISLRHSEVSDDRFVELVKDNTSDPIVSKLGYSNDSLQSLDGSNLIISSNSVYLADGVAQDASGGSRYIPEFKDGKMFFDLGESSDAESVLICKRVNNTEGIYKEFKSGIGPFTHQGVTGLPQEAYEDEDRKEYVEIDLKHPIEYGRLNQFKAEISQDTYLKMSKDYISGCADAEFTVEQFLDKCEHLDYNKSNINEFGIQNFSVSFQTKYFPIYKDVTLIVKLKDGQLVQVSKDDIAVNQTSGILDVPTFNIGRGEDIEAFYIFYGIMPCIKMAEDATIDLYRHINPNISLNLLEIDSHSPYSAPRLTNQYIVFNTHNFTEYAETSLYIPHQYSNWFIESDANIAVNGSLLTAGNRVFYTNDGLNNLSISAPANILDLLEPVTFNEDTDRYSIKNYVAGNLVSIFGKFTIGHQESIAHICFSRKVNANKVIHSYGYGKGQYSFGAYSSGSVQQDPDPRTNLLYKDNSPEEYFILDDDISFTIDSSKDGYSFHIPACTVKENIKVYELLGESVKNEFGHWDFQVPDSITIHRDKIRQGAKYLVVVKPIINPLLTTLYVNSGTFKSASLKNIKFYSGSLKGLFSLNSKQVNFKFGTKLKDGTIVYFKPELRADMIISKETIIAITSKFKDILF